MKRLFLLYTLLSLVGCTEVTIENIKPVASKEYYAVIEERTSRTYVDEQIRMRWTAEDYVTIFTKNTYNRTFMFTGKTGDNAGGFRQTSVDDPYWFGYDVANSYAVYPHSTDNKLDETDLFLTLNMPAEQTYAENSFGLGANTMVAVSDNNQLIFKNVGSYLRIRLYGNNTSISSITLTNKGNEAIAGAAKVTPVINGEPTCVMTGSGKSIRLTCPTPVSISSDANDPTDFWLVVPPVTLASGFTVTVENSDGKTQTYDVNKSFTFERNKYNNMVREVKIESDIPYVTFTADATQTLTMSKAVETLEYSVNGGEWKELGTNTVTFGGENGNLRLRGKNEYGTATSPFNYSKIIFGNENTVICNGDIRTLIDYSNYSTVYTGHAKFCSLFQECFSLTTAPQLPAMTLAEECYYNMFNYCKNLTTAPTLPATELSEACYGMMFTSCKNLTIAPDLPATTLTENCYYSMFNDCSKLTTAPKLPAMKLAKYCYYLMFYNCINLKNISQLPATKLADYCYDSMFSGCTSLTNAPQISATTLAFYCCEYMFSHCTNLTFIPDLPAITLSAHCYKGMFLGCTNLTSAPQLPATALAAYCYQDMFRNCSKLNNITMLATDISANSCLTNWTYGVASVGTFTKAPNMESLPIGIDGVPHNWLLMD